MDKITLKTILEQLKDVYDNLAEEKEEEVRKYRYTLAHTIANMRIDEITA